MRLRRILEGEGAPDLGAQHPRRRPLEDLIQPRAGRLNLRHHDPHVLAPRPSGDRRRIERDEQAPRPERLLVLRFLKEGC